jgi:hypothetical protein
MVMTKKKRFGTKAQIRDEKEKERRRATGIFLAVILLTTVFSVYFGYTILNSSPNVSSSGPTLQFNPENPDAKLKAVIVDQLSLTFPNQTFVQTATAILNQAGYTVDYYSGQDVTVEFFRNLPTRDYSLIILREHSTSTGQNRTDEPVTFFTSERCDSTKYVYEQITDQLRMDCYSQAELEKGITYFGIAPSFVTQSIQGSFHNATIIVMGCEALRNSLMAQAFVQKGAKVYVSWNNQVTATHTDTATTRLIQRLVTEKQTIRQAVYDTMMDVGLDPEYESMLGYYPKSVGNQTI